MPEPEPADPRKLKPAAVMAAEILGLLLEALRQEFAAGRWAAFEAAKGFLEGPAPTWVARAAALLRDAPEDDEAELCHRLRGAFLELERATRAAMRLLSEEKRCRRDGVCAGPGLAETRSHSQNLKDLLELLRSLAPALSEGGLRQLLELGDAPEPPPDSRLAHPAARLAGLLLLDAGRRGASDVLVVPGSWASLVEYRLGGLLVPVMEISLSYHRALVGRFKSMASLDLHQRRRPQEGASPAEGEGPRSIVRVLPTAHGERLDIHLEGPPKPLPRLSELGLSREDLGRYEGLLHSRGGLILHAGLSHTGRRTALLCGLAELAGRGCGTLALLRANPYEAPGVSVSLAAAGTQEHEALWRGILDRHPDAVGLDDVSDAKLMREALQAASGGVLVLAGLPCDGAVAALRRLMDMEMPADLLRQALLGVCAHRLPRRLCACRRAAPGDPESLRPVGCPACMHTGFRGAVPVFELLTMSGEFKALLKPGVPDQDWQRCAEAGGMTSFQESLKTLVREGAISPGEARRQGLSS